MIWKILIVFLISMIPIIEIRGALPIGIGEEFGLPIWLVLIVTFIGNLLPIPFIFLFARKVLNWGSTVKWKPFKKFCDFCLKKGEKAGDKLTKKVKGGVYWALFLFVAIPIPGTGAWTGTLAASILNLDFKKTIYAIIPGILVAGLITLAITKPIIDAVPGI